MCSVVVGVVHINGFVGGVVCVVDVIIVVAICTIVVVGLFVVVMSLCFVLASTAGCSSRGLLGTTSSSRRTIAMQQQEKKPELNRCRNRFLITVWGGGVTHERRGVDGGINGSPK